MKTKWRIFTAIVLLYSFGIVGVVWQTYHSTALLNSPNISATFEAVKMFLAMLGGLGVILPTYLNIWNSLEAQKQDEERIRFDKIENTFRLIERWDAPSILEARKYTRNLKEKHEELSPKELIKEIEENPDLKQSVIHVLNYFETARVSLLHGRIVEHVFADSINEVFEDIFERFKPYIKEKCSEKVYVDLKELQKYLEEKKS